MSTTTGIPTGALYGLTRMLVKFLKENVVVGEDYCAFVIDVKGGSTYRKQLYEQYKAHRPETLNFCLSRSNTSVKSWRLSE